MKQLNIPNLPKDYSDASQIEKWMSGIQKLFQSKNDADNKKEIEIEDSRFPVGSWYVQYPSVESNDEDTAFPPSLYPSELFGGTWTEKFTGEGVVFQTAETTDHYTRTNGLMEDHLEDHTHYAYIWCSNTSGSGYWCLITRNGSSGQGAFATGVPISGRHGSRTAHRNRVMKLWHRES